MAKTTDRARTRRLRTLVIDIGASGIKALILDSMGRPVTERIRMDTPSPATPKAVLNVLQDLAANSGKFDRVTVGFPGIVHDGRIATAVNLHDKWHRFPLAAKLRENLGKPARVINDADLQGFGAITGRGVEMVITLGTAFGSALFVDGKLVPNLEVALYPFDGKRYQEMLGDAARKQVGSKKWNKRLRHAIRALDEVFNYDRLYIGGGNSKRVRLKLPRNVRLVPNEVALLGGIALWK
jgi:polyphosphate glucokinase